MGAIGLNPIRLDRIGLDPIRINAIKLGVPGAASGTERPYIDPEVLASLKAVCICYGKSNDDPDRAVVKNLVDPDNPFVISNAAFKLNSGFGKYEVDFLDWSINSSTITERTSFAFSAINTTNSDIISIYQIVPAAVQSLKIKVNLSGRLLYRYYVNNGDTISVSYYEVKEGINILPDSVDPTSVSGKVGFVLKGLSSVKLEQIPSFEGAFVTDGIGDLITSTKTVQEMLGGSNEITVVSMIHQIADRGSTYPNIYNNQIRYSTRLLRSTVTAANVVGKTGIYGYTATGVSITGTPTGKVVNDILGDKNDYPYLASAFTGIDAESHFSVEGYLSDSGNINETSKVAWYWTIIANKVLTSDQINQVIAYFNLDRTLKSDIYCNIAKQGITNENHAEFGDKMIDFSGNGRDIQLNNIAWKGDSGIGKYEVDFASLNYNNTTSVFTATYKSCSISKIIKNGVGNIFYNWGQTLAAINSTKIQVIGLDEIGAILEFTYLDESGNSTTKQYSTDGIYDLPASAAYQGDSHNTNFRFSIRGYIGDCDITITQIPSHAGALCLDGVNDFGQFVGNLRLKDYTFIADKAYDRIALEQVPFIASKSTNSQAPFLMEYLNSDNYVYPHSFGTITKTTNLNTQRQISYQSTYVYNRNSISKGTSVDTGDGLTIGNSGSTGAQYSPLCLWSLMLFPYSMSEFLIERQLKKHKLGTLYPDMVEFRPIVKSNLPYSSISYSVNPGEYISVDSMVTITVTLPNTSDKLMEVSCNAISDISISGDNGVYEITGKIVKSPQKINMIISSYLTMLNNETLISNETLIKNE